MTLVWFLLEVRFVFGAHKSGYQKAPRETFQFNSIDSNHTSHMFTYHSIMFDSLSLIFQFWAIIIQNIVPVRVNKSM